jgi:uncharacterized protein
MNGFESVGKLSLSNYLLQTVICTTIFYGYGLGLFGKLGIIPGIFLCLIIYGIQLIGSYMLNRSCVCGLTFLGTER